MTASCPSTVKVKEHFKVKYVLLNNLQDFLAVRLVWTPEGRGQVDDAALTSVVCRSPLSNLGHCRKGSTLSFSVNFQVLKPGLYEVQNDGRQVRSGPVMSSSALTSDLCCLSCLLS